MNESRSNLPKYFFIFQQLASICFNKKNKTKRKLFLFRKAKVFAFYYYSKSRDVNIVRRNAKQQEIIQNRAHQENDYLNK